jgi:transketolase
MNYETILKELVLQDEKYIIVTAENRSAIRNLPALIGDKFLDVGICEQTMVGVAAGLSLRKRIPIIHALATFLTMRAFEFIRTDIGIANLNVKIVGSFAGLLSEANGPTHQAIEDIALMRGIPNINIFCPADEEDMLIGLPQVLKSNDAFYIRYNNSKPRFNHSKNFHIGKSEIISIGNDITILTYGYLFSEAYVSKSILEDKGYSVGLVNMRTLKPIDEEVIIKSIKCSKLVVTLEDHFQVGGLFTIVSEITLINKIMGNVFPIAFNNRWFKPALINDVLKYEGLLGEDISKKIEHEYLRIEEITKINN